MKIFSFSCIVHLLSAKIIMLVYQLMESIEWVSRRHLNLKRIHELSSGMDVHKLILDDVLRSELVLACWEIVAHHIPNKYEPYSLQLLQHVTDLWIIIRGHSFVKEFTTKFEKKYKKGTRKTLKQGSTKE